MKLCKYVPLERLDILFNACIRFSQPTVFNDPFEMSPVIKGAASVSDLGSTNDVVSQARATFEALPDEVRSRLAFEQFFEEFVEHLNQRLHDDGAIEELTHALLPRFHSETGVLSLAERPDNLLMWSHYGDQHRGFVIEFDADHPFFDQRQDDDDLFHRLWKVQYASARPITTLGGFLGPHSLLTKSVEWEYEQEWRMLVDLKSVPHETRNVGNEEIHLVPIPPTCIARVFLGCRMPDERRAEVLNLVTRDSRYAHVEVQQAKLDEEAFGVNFGPLAQHFFECGKKSVQRALRWGAGERSPEHRDRWEGLLDTALTELDKAIQLAPNEKAHLALRAATLQMMDRPARAIEDCNRALLLDPKDGALHSARGQFHLQLGQLAQAERDFQRAFKLGVVEAQAYLDALKQAKADAAGQGERSKKR